LQYACKTVAGGQFELESQPPFAIKIDPVVCPGSSAVVLNRWY